jgi:hypothetical protein
MAVDTLTMVATSVLEYLPAPLTMLGKNKDAAFPQQLGVLH